MGIPTTWGQVSHLGSDLNPRETLHLSPHLLIDLRGAACTRRRATPVASQSRWWCLSPTDALIELVFGGCLRRKTVRLKNCCRIAGSHQNRNCVAPCHQGTSTSRRVAHPLTKQCHNYFYQVEFPTCCSSGNQSPMVDGPNIPWCIFHVINLKVQR